MSDFTVEELNKQYSKEQPMDFLLEYNPDNFWEELGKYYTNTFHTPEAISMNIPIIRNRLYAIKAKRILEVGCGFGRVLSALYAMKSTIGYDYLVGLEMSKTMIESSENMFHNILKMEDHPEIVNGNAKAIPFPDKNFDTTYTHVCLTHIPPEDIPTVIKEIDRVTTNYIIHVERYAWYYEHTNPHRWSHNIVDPYIALGWKVLEYTTAKEEHYTRVLVLGRK